MDTRQERLKRLGELIAAARKDYLVGGVPTSGFEGGAGSGIRLEMSGARYSPEHRSLTADFVLGQFSGSLGLFDQPNESKAKENLRGVAERFRFEIERVFDQLKLTTGYYEPKVSFKKENLPPGIHRIDVIPISPPDGRRDYHSAEVKVYNTGNETSGKPDIHFSVSKRY